MTLRRKYSKEFKLDAVSLVNEQGFNQSEAARRPGINANMLGRWVKELESNDGLAFRGNGKMTSEHEEIRQLKAEKNRLKMEKEPFKRRRYSLQQKRSEILVYHPA